MKALEQLKLLKQKGLLTPGGSSLLNEWMDKYPWFSAGYVLQGLNATVLAESEDQFEKALHYSQDKKWIRFLMDQFSDTSIGTIQWPSEIERPSETPAPQPIATKKEEEAGSLNNTENILEEEVDALIDGLALSEAADDLDKEEIFPHDEEKLQDLTDAELDSIALQEANDLLDQTPVPTQTETAKSPEQDLLFEPFHTVDYFASQGIKLREEKMGNDPLSNQVKTFTQWLRTMKKIYVEEEKILEKKEDDMVNKIAANSNQEEEVITETMAKVLVQQGKTSKAEAIYRKLSLLYPEKSSYFASLIEELNKRS